MSPEEQMTVAEQVAYARGLVENDWIVTRAWNRLHRPLLDVEQLQEMFEYRCLPGPIRLACGQTAVQVSIPGVFTRMGAQRCRGCCRAVGYPPGKGSPKNDETCRDRLKEVLAG